MFDRYFDEHGFRPRVIMRFDNGEGIKTRLQRGLGITMPPKWTVEQELKNKTFSLIRQREAPLLATMALITRKASYVPQPVNALIALARKWKWEEQGSRNTRNKRKTRDRLNDDFAFFVYFACFAISLPPI